MKKRNENKEIPEDLNIPDLRITKDTSSKKCYNCKEKVTPTKELMCPLCNHYMLANAKASYQPISRKTRNKIKLILGVVLSIVAVILLWNRITSCG